MTIFISIMIGIIGLFILNIADNVTTMRENQEEFYEWFKKYEKKKKLNRK